MKSKLIFAAATLAICFVACEKKTQSANALLGKWTWQSQIVGCAPEYISIETPETTGEKRELLFEKKQWHYFVNDSLVKENSYSCSTDEKPNTLWWNYGTNLRYEVTVKWLAPDSISLDLAEGGGCQGPSVWAKIE